MLRKTKIICTLGPATDDESVLRRLMLGGMNGARFKLFHCTHEDAAKKLEAVTRLRKSWVCLWPPFWIPKARRSE